LRNGQKFASDRAKETLSLPTLHELWDHTLVLPQAKFFDRVFSSLRQVLSAPIGATILDAGCGPARHSILLARNLWHVRAVDFSNAALELARRNVEEAGVSDRVELSRENLTKLSLPDDSQPYVLCWGVLMHIPDIAAAVSELSRVAERGGKIVVSELNMSSPESRALRTLARARSHPGNVVSAGAEHWRETESGSLLIRHANIDWLQHEFANQGVMLRARFAGQISELHAPLRNRAAWAARTVDFVNHHGLWSEALAPFAISNILIFEKAEDILHS
jgi:2-polyprenyl-3-methyl-5-hydroxy-6-metoxy-1,4-benzoquinol methylase